MKKNLFKKFALVMTLALSCSVVFTACGSSESTDTSAKTTVDQKITYVSMTDAIGVSPILTNDSGSSNVIRNIYETLFTKDPETGEIKPLLAESYENPDANTWVIKLRKNIKFQDGETFNAAAVKYTFEKIMDPKTASPRASLLKSVDKIETPDDYTVKIHTKTPYGIMLTALAHDNLSIVSPKADKAADINKNATGAGTGPYSFKEWVSGDHITLVKNKDYWGGTPKLDSVTFKVVPEMATAVSMVDSGEADMVTGIPPEQLDRLKNNKDVSVTVQKGNPVRYLGFNFQKKPFDNLKVRQAIEAALDRDSYISTLNGLGYKSMGIIGPKLIGYDKEVENHGIKFNLDNAKNLLKEAGYPDGFKTTLTLTNSDNYTKLAPFIQAQLKKIGIEVTLNTMDSASFTAYAKSGKQDMYLSGWVNVTGDGEELLYPQFFSTNSGATNFNMYKNPDSDKLIISCRETVDQNQRAAFINQANIKFTDDVLWVPMYHDNVSMAVRKNVKGVVLESNGEFRFNKAYKE